MSVELQRRLFAVDEYHAMARAGVPEVWLVDLERRHVEVDRSPTGDGYADSQRVGAGDGLQPEGIPGVALRVNEILG